MPQATLAKILRVHKVEVNRAIKEGRLKACVQLNSKGVPQIADVELAKKEWLENGDYTDAPARVPEGLVGNLGGAHPVETDADGTPTLQNAAARSKHYEAELKRLKLEEAEGLLVSAADVEHEWADLLSQVRTRLLAVPTRVKQSLPTLTVADIVTIENLIREALEDLVAEKSA